MGVQPTVCLEVLHIPDSPRGPSLPVPQNSATKSSANFLFHKVPAGHVVHFRGSLLVQVSI